MIRTLLTFLPLIRRLTTQGVEILHFEGDKIKEAWTIADMSNLAQ